MKKIFLLLTIGSIGLLSSCAYDKVEPKPLPDTVSYQNDIQPIWNQSCTTCHSPSGGETPDLSTGNSYNALTSGGFVTPGNADASSLYQILKSGEMPPGGPLPQDKIDLVKKWINDGALNN